jgi:hypothetical protein
MYTAMGDVVQSPDSIRGQSVLAAAAIVIQGLADVEVDGRVSPTSVFFLSLAASGERKSSTDRAALAAHEEWQRTKRAEAPKILVAYEAEQSCWQSRHDDIKADATISGDKLRSALNKLGPAPHRPYVPLIKVAEPTFEGLVRSLAVDYPVTSIVSDDAGAFLGGYAMSRDNALRTAAGLAELWDGKPISRPRGSEPNQVHYGRRVSLSLMAQPGVAAQTLLTNRLLTEQGLLARMFISYPNSNIGYRPYREQTLGDLPAVQAYWDRMKELLSLPLPFDIDHPGAVRPRVLTLSREAKSAFVLFADHMERLQQPGQILAQVSAFASKAPEHALRLATHVGLVESPEKQMLSLSDIKAGIALAQFYTNEYLRILTTANDNPDLLLAEDCLRWMHDCGKAPLFSLPDIYQFGPNPLRSKAGAARILGVLAEHGYVRELSGSHLVRGAMRRNVWELRPDAFSKIYRAAC